jgi:hypothetical protein
MEPQMERPPARRRSPRYHLLLSSILLFSFALFLQGCKDQQIQTLAKTVRAVAEANNQLQKDSEALHAVGSLTTDETRTIMEVVIKIAKADEEANQLIIPLSKLETVSKQQILMVMQPVITAVDNLIAQDVIKISNPDAKVKIQMILSSIRSSLDVVYLIVSK